MRSVIVSASCWSWVTNTKVTPVLALDALQLELHGLAQLEVEGGERLVEEQGGGPVDQRPGQRDPLLLAAGELGRPAAGEAVHAHDLEHLADPRCELGLRHLAGSRSPKATLSATDMWGNRAYCWNTVLTLRR